MSNVSMSHSFLLSDTTPVNPYNCMEVISCSSKHYSDLSETSLSNPDLVFYTDGSAYRENGVPYVGYAICDHFSIIESAALPPSSSAQVAELYVLMPVISQEVKLLRFIQIPDMLLDVYMTLVHCGQSEDSSHPRGHQLNMAN